MRLYPLPHSKLENARAIFTKAHGELKTQPKATIEQAMASVAKGYENRTVAVYVDDIENPKHCLAVALVPGFLVEGLMVVCLLIYSVPEERGKTEPLDALHLTLENYARIHGAETILGSSWIYRGSRGIDAMWKDRGFEPQETTYVKLLQ